MSARGILSSPYQRRVIATSSIVSIILLLVCVILINAYAPETRRWDLLSAILVAVTGSAMFALLSAALLSFFSDPAEIEASTQLLPRDIAGALDALARGAPDYMLYVRTGRHFRAKVLPVLIAGANADRRMLKVDVVLLDFRNAELCQRYASYRGWQLEDVQREIMSTILSIIDAASKSRFLDIELYLSPRLSIFRLDGTADEIIVTREDRRDLASRYKRSNPYFVAFRNEFTWVKAEAFQVRKISGTTVLPGSLQEMFGELEIIRLHLNEAIEAKSNSSPYE